MAEIHDANQQIELAQTNLTNRIIEISTIDELCNGLRARLAPVLGAISGELVYDVQSMGQEVITTTSQANETLANETRDSVYRATEGTPNDHAVDARIHIDHAVDVSALGSRIIIGPTNELLGQFEQLKATASSILSLLDIVQDGQNRLNEIAGEPDSPVHPVLPSQRESGQYEASPGPAEDGPAAIPGTIFALEQLKHDI